MSRQAPEFQSPVDRDPNGGHHVTNFFACCMNWGCFSNRGIRPEGIELPTRQQSAESARQPGSTVINTQIEEHEHLDRMYNIRETRSYPPEAATNEEVSFAQQLVERSLKMLPSINQRSNVDWRISDTERISHFEKTFAELEGRGDTKKETPHNYDKTAFDRFRKDYEKRKKKMKKEKRR